MIGSLEIQPEPHMRLRSLFPSDSLQSQLYEFIEIAHIDYTMV